MIVSFGDVETKAIFQGKRSKKLPPSIHRVAMRKSWIIDAAVNGTGLRGPTGNSLEKRSGSYSGYHSIRINGQWRVCFKWKDGNAQSVSIVDYH